MLTGLCPVLNDQESQFLSWFCRLCWMLENSNVAKLPRYHGFSHAVQSSRPSASNQMVTCYE